QNVGKALESVEDILGAVLAISRLDTGRQETRIQAFPIARILEQMRIEFNPVAQERGLDLRIINSSLWLKSDPALLRRLLQNLISNAIKYTPSGKVLVGCRRRGGNISIEVADTGIGMAQEDLASIFTEFRRLDAGVKQAPGLGLGLSIVQRISGVLGHPVTVESRQGKGTSFRFLVERAEAEISKVEPKPAEVPLQNSARLEDVFALCIDNDPSILEGMATLLSQWGCEVRTAPDREASLNAIREIGRAPDIVFADYHLDNETGIEAIDAIRSLYGSDFPAVLVTADRTQSVKASADAKGIVMLHKPVRPAGLRAILSMCRTSRDAAE
ncbi:MAG: hybrid sensor histidine kinase/response regulator, partial [Nitratireductor sp.]